jgi:hypothetical protein
MTEDKKPRRNSKEEQLDLSHLSFEEAVRHSWEAEPPPKKRRGEEAARNAEQPQHESGKGEVGD